ncbi:polysaccharide pyruvyl transferase family protein [Nonomuraea guangzhouensis]|uniref:Polysaccharide pyruvyl transferase family protein n=1 Tax=Nonomuraea guangzhouensis TaxID=1291555 RepID=A0ABW4GRU2_9ACTN|nr:polysaccharide pyruvyl transferase family protein [Nonomuraea guangzhouensis]
MNIDTQPLRIGISGSYGGMNLGDEAILQAILAQLRASLVAEITVFSHNPSDTLARHRVEHAISARLLPKKEARQVVKELDLLILGGGGILYDGGAEAYLREVFLAHELGVPVFIYAVSAGPLRTPSAMQAVRDALNHCAVITVRDRLGYRLLEDVGVQNEIHLTADPAFLLEPEEMPIDALVAEGVQQERNLVGFSVREPGPAAPDIDPEDYYALLANAADYVVERYDAEVVFVPMEKTDVQHSHAVVAHMQNAESAEILRRRYSPGQVLDLMRRFEFAVGMRLHFLIFAALQGTAFSALPYASKVVGLLEDLKIDSPPLANMGIGQLIAHVDRSWDTRKQIKAKIENRLPSLIHRANQTNALLSDFARKEPPS